MDALKLILDALYELRGVKGDAETKLIGSGAAVDSLGLVTLVLEVEQRLAEQNINVVLTDEQAMSRKHSPFRTVGMFAKYMEERLCDS